MVEAQSSVGTGRIESWNLLQDRVGEFTAHKRSCCIFKSLSNFEIIHCSAERPLVNHFHSLKVVDNNLRQVSEYMENPFNKSLSCPQN